jgi:hypothetical protein
MVTSDRDEIGAKINIICQMNMLNHTIYLIMECPYCSVASSLVYLWLAKNKFTSNPIFYSVKNIKKR